MELRTIEKSRNGRNVTSGWTAMNVINRWKTVPKELRDETMEHEYGWMIKYLLESCTVLVPPEAVRKNSLSHIEKSLEHDLYELGFDANVRIKVYPGVIARGMDYIAEAEFLGGFK